MFEVKNVKRKVQKFKFGNGAPKFVLRGDVGAPVGCVRSPRLGDPPHVSWVIDTHWSDKRWKRELQN